MSRSGYVDDIEDNWQLIMWRGQVASAIRGRRGQAFLRELIVALDALPKKELIANELRHGDEVCALGSVGVRRDIDLEVLDPEDRVALAKTFGVAAPLIQEIEWVNDEMGLYLYPDTPEKRWQRVRQWAVENIREAKP